MTNNAVLQIGRIARVAALLLVCAGAARGEHLPEFDMQGCVAGASVIARGELDKSGEFRMEEVLWGFKAAADAKRPFMVDGVFSDVKQREVVLFLHEEDGRWLPVNGEAGVVEFRGDEVWLMGPGKIDGGAFGRAKEFTRGSFFTALRAELKAAVARAAQVKVASAAQGWWDASVALAKKGRLIAVLQIHRENGQVLEYRYDRFPGIDRVITQGWGNYLRVGGMGWTPAPGWQRPGGDLLAQESSWHGFPQVVPQDDSEDEAPEEFADFGDDPGTVADLARKPFLQEAPDPVEGRMIFTGEPDGSTFRQRREKKRSGGYDPVFYFNTDPGDQLGKILRSVKMDCTWQDAPAHVVIRYFYRPDEIEPPGNAQPEERAAAELRAAAAKPVKVDAVVRVDGRDRVAGIISGNDFDFTIEKPGKSWRQIAVGEESWVTKDGGTTWEKQAASDRIWFNMLRRPLDAVALTASHWPFEPPDPAKTEAGGETLRLLTPDAVENAPPGQWRFYPTPQRYQVAFKDGKGAELRRFDGGMYFPAADFAPGEKSVNPTAVTFAMIHAEYSAAPEAKVLPPPGGPAIVPAERAEEMLVKAVDAMGSGVWRVSRGRRSLDNEGHEPGGPPGRPANGIIDSSGLISGRDFDLTNTHYDGRSDVKIIERRVGVNGKVWSSTDAGKTWREETNLNSYFMFPADLIWTPSPAYDLPLCTVVGTETHDGESWLHIRVADGGTHFWLELDKAGKALWVRRYATPTSGGALFENGRVVMSTYEVEDFAPAKEGEEVKPPVAAK